MTNIQVISSLKGLRKDSGKRIPDNFITEFTKSNAQARNQLIQRRSDSSDLGTVLVPTKGIASLPRNTQKIRKIKTLDVSIEDNQTYQLNTALLGGTSYPILTAVLGTIVGVASGGAGLLFTIASTAISMSQTSHRVLARGGDEIWQVEEIGKTGSKAVHVGSYFLVDPYRSRSQSRTKGWLIHEERNKLDI
jgi:hypothetical protein